MKGMAGALKEMNSLSKVSIVIVKEWPGRGIHNFSLLRTPVQTSVIGTKNQINASSAGPVHFVYNYPPHAGMRQLNLLC